MSETQTYIECLRALRANTLKTLDGVSAAELNWKPTRRETNSLFVLATHLLGSERHWFHRVIGRREIQRDREAEFLARGKNAAAFRGEFDAVAKTTEEILAQLPSTEYDATRATPNYNTVSVRWCVLHMIEHYAEHQGHMLLTRQLWNAQRKKGPKSQKRMKSVRRNR